MKTKTLIMSSAALITALALGPAVAAHGTSDRPSAGETEVVRSTSDSDVSRIEPNGVAGVAKALHAGFKAANAYKAAAKVAGWASIIGSVENPRHITPEIEAAYFDR